MSNLSKAKKKRIRQTEEYKETKAILDYFLTRITKTSQSPTQFFLLILSMEHAIKHSGRIAAILVREGRSQRWFPRF